MTGGGHGGREGPGDQASSGGEPPAGGLALEVVAGHPSAEELAALTVALSTALAASSGPAGRAGRASPGWADRSRLVGAPLTPGRDAWRRSAQPGTLSRYQSGLLPP